MGFEFERSHVTCVRVDTPCHNLVRVLAGHLRKRGGACVCEREEGVWGLYMSTQERRLRGVYVYMCVCVYVCMGIVLAGYLKREKDKKREREREKESAL